VTTMAAPPTMYVNTADVPWVERHRGVFWKVLWQGGDGHKAILMRYEPGAVIPRHRHLGDEQIWVLEGSVADDTGVCTAGNYARRPPGCVHSVKSETGALVLAVTSGPTEAV
jgi:anti-sigma factor ChrR (cupin superfamily)